MKPRSSGNITLVAPPSEIKAYVRLVVTDPKGKVLSDSGEQESHSFVIQFLEFIHRVFSTVDTAFTDTSNAETIGYSGGSGNAFGVVAAPINVSTLGIVVGTSDQAESNTDHDLIAQLTEGVGVGNITHNQCTVNFAPAVVGANVDMVLLRSFTNNTGALITVKETGIYTADNSNTFYHCHVRDVLASATDIADKCSLSVFYTLRTTV